MSGWWSRWSSCFGYKQRWSANEKKGGGLVEEVELTNALQPQLLLLLLHLPRTLFERLIQHHPQPLNRLPIPQMGADPSCDGQKQRLELLRRLVKRTLISSSFVQSPGEGEFSKARMTEGEVYYGLVNERRTGRRGQDEIGGKEGMGLLSFVSLFLRLTFRCPTDQSENFSFEIVSAATIITSIPLATRSEWLKEGFVEGKVKTRSTREGGREWS